MYYYYYLSLFSLSARRYSHSIFLPCHTTTSTDFHFDEQTKSGDRMRTNYLSWAREAQATEILSFFLFYSSSCWQTEIKIIVKDLKWWPLFAIGLNFSFNRDKKLSFEMKLANNKYDFFFETFNIFLWFHGQMIFQFTLPVHYGWDSHDVENNVNKQIKKE